MPKLNYVTTVAKAGGGSVFRWNAFYNAYTYDRPMDQSFVDAKISAILSKQFVVDPELPYITSFPSDPKWLAGFAAARESGDSPLKATFSIPLLKDGVKNANFGARRRQGEIVLSPYRVRKCTFELVNGFSIYPESALGSQFLESSNSSHSEILGTSIGRDGKYWIPMGNEVGNLILGVHRGIGDVKFDISPTNLVSLERLTSLYSGVLYTEADPAWVQSVIAEANARAVDWLTSLAELPETIRYAIDALRSLAGILKKWRSREESIRQLFARRRTEILAEISRLTQKLARARAPSLIRDIRFSIKRLNRKYSRLGKELISALTSAWLQYRYAIMPNVYLIEDSLEALKNLKFEYFVSRDKTALTLVPPSLGENWVWNGTSTCTGKVMIKYQYRPFASTLESVSRVASANIALTAWELKSLSFVWDWFFTVGDALSAGFGTPGNIVSKGMTLSYKTEILGQYVEKNTGCIISVDYTAYERLCPDPGSFLGIYFRKNLNWKRYLDSFALAWPLLKKSVR